METENEPTAAPAAAKKAGTTRTMQMLQVIGKKSKSPLRNFSLNDPSLLAVPSVQLAPANANSEAAFLPKRLDLFETVKIGRRVGPKVGPEADNGIFDSRVLSRQHAELKADAGRAYVRDVGSSNGTFVNGARLSEDGQTSEWTELKTGDTLDFGINIMNDDGTTVMYSRVSCTVAVGRVGGDGKADDADVRPADQPNGPRAGAPAAAAVPAALVEKLEAELGAAREAQAAVLQLADTLSQVETAAREIPLAQETLQKQLAEAMAQNTVLVRRAKELQSLEETVRAQAARIAELEASPDADRIAAFEKQIVQLEARCALLESERDAAARRLQRDKEAAVARESDLEAKLRAAAVRAGRLVTLVHIATFCAGIVLGLGVAIGGGLRL